jgi:cysteinyl-tRNA synthetase
MAQRYLGDAFDLHGGGLDLRFPHHENEQAQSRAAGYGFARYWLHSAWVTQGGTKMSKSLGNGLLVREVLLQAPASALRYALTAVHYRSMLEWTSDTLAEAEATWDRFAGFVSRASELVGNVDDAELRSAALPAAFVTAMDDDLNVPAALAVTHEHLRLGNTALAAAASAGPDSAEGDTARRDTRTELVAVRAMLDVLGLDPGDPHWAAGGESRYAEALGAVVQAELDARAAARASRDFATADAIRDRLAASGILVEDQPNGARWSLAASPHPSPRTTHRRQD